MRRPNVRRASACLLLALAHTAGAGPEPWLTPPRENAPPLHALVGATVYLRPEQRLLSATVVLRGAQVVSVKAGADVPPGARVWDCAGLTIYPGFIEPAATLGLPTAEDDEGGNEWDEGRVTPPLEPLGGPASWNPRVRPQWRAADHLDYSAKEAAELREMGFTSAFVAPRRGVFAGQGALVSLGAAGPRDSVRPTPAHQFVRFENASYQERVYPVSLMGAIALVRQTFLDAEWHELMRTGFPEHPANAALEALHASRQAAHGEGPSFVFTAEDELDFARIERLAEEFKLTKVAVLGNGYEYRVPAQLPRRGPLIVPLAFPKAPDVSDPDAARDLPLHELEHWRYAPSNPAAVVEAGRTIALTAGDLKAEDFWENLRLAVRRGLRPAKALAALTAEPAKLHGLSRRGYLGSSAVADLVVARGDLFTDNEAEIVAVWVEGERFELPAGRRPALAGDYELAQPPDAPIGWHVRAKGRGFTLQSGEGEPVRLRPAVGAEGAFTARVPAAWVGAGHGAGEATVRLELVEDGLSGSAELPDGAYRPLTALRSLRPADATPASATEAAAAETAKAAAETEATIRAPDKYPAGEYGEPRRQPAPPPQTMLRGATIWPMNGSQPPFVGAVILSGNRIDYVGPPRAAPAGALVVDVTGLHITPGIIDCHSHIAISGGVNEGSDAVTAEVRVQDVLDPTDINLYRQLAAGVTTSNLLHGSANVIGGQGAVIQLRWGGDADALRLLTPGPNGQPVDASPGVKFALGENPKRSNFTGAARRYPATRMGVAEVLDDAFDAASEYASAKANGRRDHLGRPLRPNLRLDALLEIAANTRRIHIHCYRADEIDQFVAFAVARGLKGVTFQHFLEGYKVGPEIARIEGVGASLFADMWAFKFEAYDAIPYAPAMLAKAQILTSVNSDNSELARRLNLEAAKAMKYGGLTPLEALALVTINPAKQLRIDRLVGSLVAGKQADLVVWSGDPLSPLSRVRQTWLEGRLRWSDALEAERRAADQAARAALTALARAAAEDSDGAGSGKDRAASAVAAADDGSGDATRWERVYREGHGYDCGDHHHH